MCFGNFYHLCGPEPHVAMGVLKSSIHAHGIYQFPLKWCSLLLQPLKITTTCTQTSVVPEAVCLVGANAWNPAITIISSGLTPSP